MSEDKKQLYSEENRLKTFSGGWPLAYLKPETLAKCGFFYIGDGDRVSCPFCGIVIFNWQSGDEPIFEHKIHSGKCPFINGQDVGNIFIGSDPRESYGLAQAQDVCGFNHIEEHPSQEEKAATSPRKPSVDPGIDFKTPSSNEFVTYGSRLASFNDWPITDIITPAQLAESGFYFKGPVIDYLGRQYNDFVTCFHCGVSLCQWTKEDDPWEEHKKFNSKCMFVNLVTQQDKTEPLPINNSSAEPSSAEPPSAEPSSAEPSTIKPFKPYNWLPKPETEDLTCGVCLDLQVGAVFYPCSHTSCPLCAASLSNCPICRSKILTVIKLDYKLSRTEISFF